jgi:hypothetical protein
MNNTSRSPIRLATSATASKLLPPLRRGLTVIAVDSTELLHPVKAVITQVMLAGSRDLPVPMPKLDVVSDMIVGSQRYLDHFKALHLEEKAIEGAASYKPVYLFSSMPIDWTGPGGLMLLDQHLKGEAKMALVLVQHTGIRTHGLAVEGLYSIQRKARNAKFNVVMVTELEKSDRATCCRITDEFFEVSRCEPDPGWKNAFIIDCVELSRIPGLGQGRVMCNFKLTERGYEFGLTPFLSANVDVRLMAILKAQGMTLKDIGSLIAKDKSNVSRDLSGVPLLKKMPFTKADLSRWLESCGTGPEQISKGMKIFADFEKTNVVAPSVQEIRNDRNTRNTSIRKLH